MKKMAWAVLTMAAAATIGPAGAQSYGAGYPVCLRIYGPVSYNDCSYATLEQCQVSAAGRAGQCLVNPFAAHAAMAPSRTGKRRTAY